MSLPTRLLLWLAHRRRGQLEICAYDYEFRNYLNEIWAPPEPPPIVSDSICVESIESDICFSRARPRPLDWKIAFTTAFSKAVAAADRSMQGRILLALADISSDPATPRGDTVKPLSGEKHGLWRYRLGDYRLVYEPQSNERMVVLVDFAARGGVYE